jgi:multicomponent Na+:H+ antiporter subunit C
MSRAIFYALVGSGLFAIGLYGLFSRIHLLRKIIAINVMSGGVFLVFVGLAHAAAGPFPDPVPHAMVLTGIVVAVSATAFALALARRVYVDTGKTHLPEDVPPRARTARRGTDQ